MALAAEYDEDEVMEGGRGRCMHGRCMAVSVCNSRCGSTAAGWLHPVVGPPVHQPMASRTDEIHGEVKAPTRPPGLYIDHTIHGDTVHCCSRLVEGSKAR